LASSFRITKDNLQNPAVLNAKLDKAIGAICQYWDGPIEAYLKLNAPWTDRTGTRWSGQPCP
jgi:hypothetical protein